MILHHDVTISHSGIIQLAIYSMELLNYKFITKYSSPELNTSRAQAPFERCFTELSTGAFCTCRTVHKSLNHEASA
jgi:hypothetical protein